MGQTTGWKVLTAGEPQALVSTHVGYTVAAQEREVTYHAHDRPAIGAALALTALALLVWSHWPRARRVAALTGIALAALPPLVVLAILCASAVGYEICEGDCKVRYVVVFAGSLALVYVLGRLWLRARARCSASNAGGVAAGALAVVLPLAGVFCGWPGEARMRPEVLARLQRIESLTAATEAQAVRLGRWPTPEEWQAAHGQPRDDGGALLCYDVGLRGNEINIWFSTSYAAAQGWAIRRQVGGPESRQWTWYDSRLFGPDGLFGTEDDDMDWMAPKRFHRTAWPHGRAPRDPGVELPPCPVVEKRP